MVIILTPLRCLILERPIVAGCCSTATMPVASMRSVQGFAVPPNGLELSCPAEAGNLPLILAHNGGPDALSYGPARRVSFSELLGGLERIGLN